MKRLFYPLELQCDHSTESAGEGCGRLRDVKWAEYHCTQRSTDTNSISWSLFSGTSSSPVSCLVLFIGRLPSAV